MKTLSTHLPCPCCQAPLRLSALRCDACDVTIQGRIEGNEFSTLTPEELHFLRIFIFAEGRISQMEGPLGLSYPTIRNRLSQLKDKLQSAAAGMESTTPPSPPPQETKQTNKPSPPQPEDILEQLNRGEIDFEEALKSIRSSQRGSKERKSHDK